MFKSTSLLPDHKDTIHDIAFDFHGRRIATCSSDQSVKVWDQSENGQWYCSASWKTHTGSVWKVAWAHPEFGKILATCSFDRTTAIWEEIVSETGNEKTQSHWLRRYVMVDSRANVTDVKFGPKHLGLMLATCSQDGYLRIYEAPDIMNLSQWTFQHDIVVSKNRSSCLAWNPSRYHLPMIAVGSDDTNAIGCKVNIFEYSDTARKWSKADSVPNITDPVHDLAFAPNLGRSFHLLAIASRHVTIVSLKPVTQSLDGEPSGGKLEFRTLAQFDPQSSQVWRVSWNVTGTILASSGADGCVRLWKANYMDIWKPLSTLKIGETGVIQNNEDAVE